ncbi:hypothetical protein BBJ28_00026161 [Nothophytophthora sp. Chile5]|nr:hypothetical protein BBJ28_00026161 [Nothophytophthora sp. Chile5]
MVSAATLFAIAAVAAFATPDADAHGTLSLPGLTFTGTNYAGDYSATVPMTALTAQSGDIFTNYPDASLNAAAFDRAFKASTYTTLKEFLLTNQDMSLGRFSNPKTAECGFTDPTSGAVQALPDEVEWYGGKMNHDGPCEIWCDDEIVLPFTANCAVTYPEGKFPYEKSKCEGKSRLTMYWMSTLLEWQVYIDCAKIGEGGSPASATTSTTATNTTSATTAPVASTTTGATTNVTPTTTPSPTSETDLSGTVGGEASSTTDLQCKRKLERVAFN